MRVQIPVYTDRWMMGDRYGTVVKIIECKIGKPPNATTARVKLDKSGKTIRVILADCTEVK